MRGHEWSSSSQALLAVETIGAAVPPAGVAKGLDIRSRASIPCSSLPPAVPPAKIAASPSAQKDLLDPAALISLGCLAWRLCVVFLAYMACYFWEMFGKLWCLGFCVYVQLWIRA